MTPASDDAATCLPLAIVQARMTSSRLPGKVMLDLHGSPMITRQLERIERARMLSGVVVATSADASDDPLAEYLTAQGYSVLRGSLEDVLARFVRVIDENQPESIVRLTADCPLISPTVIDQIVETYLASDMDYCSNTLTPTYPDGLDVEVVRASVLRDLHASTTDRHEREHVTLGVYRHPETFTLCNYADPSGHNRSELRWTVDNADDFAFAVWVYGALFDFNPAFDYSDIVDLIERFPDKSRTVHHAARNAALQGLDTGAMNQGDDG